MRDPVRSKIQTMCKRCVTKESSFDLFFFKFNRLFSRGFQLSILNILNVHEMTKSKKNSEIEKRRKTCLKNKNKKILS